MSRRIERGSEVGRIRLVYEARKKEPPHWLRFEPLQIERPLSLRPRAGAASWTSASATGTIRFTPIFAIDNADDLVEEYSGFGLRFETRKLGTRRLGASFEWSWFDAGLA